MKAVKLLAISGLMASAAQAATLGSSASADAWAMTGAGVVVAPEKSLNNSQGVTLAGASAANAASTGGGAGSSSANASVSAGALHAAAFAQGDANWVSVDLHPVGSSATGNADAYAVILDSFVVQSQGLASGAPASLTVSFSADGSLGGSSVNHGEVSADWSAHVGLRGSFNGVTYGEGGWSGSQRFRLSGASAQPEVVNLSSDGSSPLGVHTLTIPIGIGATVNVVMYLTASAQAVAVCTVTSDLLCNPTLASATSDFSHTMKWGGITSLQDDQGRSITQFSAISADTGFNYALSAVPEPSVAGMLSSGMLVLAFARRNRKPGAAKRPAA